MRISFYILTLLLLSSFSPPEAPAVSHLTYSILRDGKVVGKIKASRTIQGSKTYYEVETHMEIKVIVTQNIDYSSKAFYEDGILQSSVSKSYLNQKLHNTCTTVLRGNRYEVKNDNAVSYIKKPVYYSGVMLYFKEPGTTNLVYSEMSGQENYMRKKAAGQYILTNSKSKNENRYYYKNSFLERAYIDHSMIDLEIQRVN
jgi:hypothetical protein